MNYQQKYIKYKQKYLEIKKKVYGGAGSFDELVRLLNEINDLIPVILTELYCCRANIKTIIPMLKHKKHKKFIEIIDTNYEKMVLNIFDFVVKNKIIFTSINKEDIELIEEGEYEPTFDPNKTKSYFDQKLKPLILLIFSSYLIFINSIYNSLRIEKLPFYIINYQRFFDKEKCEINVYDTNCCDPNIKSNCFTTLIANKLSKLDLLLNNINKKITLDTIKETYDTVHKDFIEINNQIKSIDADSAELKVKAVENNLICSHALKNEFGELSINLKETPAL